ncbi:MAG TPA: hypothetical protein VM553_16350, partial [Dongiaceae bacterium]|nr:hypothetical protein [Dongiaceae bacterium]
YGPRSTARNVREVVVKMAVSHADKKALTLFSKEIAQAGTGMAPGITNIVGGRPKVSPMIRLFSCLVPKSTAQTTVDFQGSTMPVVVDTTNGFDGVNEAPISAPAGLQTTAVVPLVKLAWARSGDKGNHGNIGVIARKPEYLPFIKAALTPAAVANYMQHLLDPQTGKVSGWELPGLDALNFLLENSLGGGGIASLRIDPQGKAFAQQLLEFPIPVSSSIAHELQAN